MTREQVKQAVVHIISEKMNMDQDKITEEMNLEHDLHVDSLDTVEITMEIEDFFNLNVPDVEVEQAKTIGKIIDLVVKLSGQ